MPIRTTVPPARAQRSTLRIVSAFPTQSEITPNPPPFHPLHLNKADDPRSDDQSLLAVARRPAQHAVQRHRHRLDQGRLIVAQIIRHQAHFALMGGVAVAPPAADPTGAALQRSVLAQTGVARRTEAAGRIDFLGEAGRAGEARLHDDPLTRTDALHARADLGHVADDLVAEVEAAVA